MNIKLLTRSYALRGNAALLPRWRVGISFAVLLSACTVGPDYQRPDANIATEFKELKGWKQAQPRDEQLKGDWWTLFNDTELNRLAAQVSINNQSLAQAEAQFRQSQSLVQQAQARD